MVEHLVWDQRVVSSNLATPTIFRDRGEMDLNHTDELNWLYSLYWSNCVTLGRKPQSKEEYIEEYTKNESKNFVQSIEQAHKQSLSVIEEFLRYEAYLDECERLDILPRYEAYLDECERLGILPREKYEPKV